MSQSQLSIPKRLVMLISSIILGFLAVSILMLSTQPVSASTINVSPGQSIQAAINAATAGDTILISAGVYTESLVLNKAVSLTGVSSATTIIQAPANSRVISVGVNVDSSVVISGLAITGGDIDDGAGLYLIGTPQLKFLHIHNNHGFDSPTETVGSGIASSGGIFSANILNLQNSLIENNTGFVGAALFAFGKVYISNTKVLNHNHYFYSGVIIAGDATISHSHFENNRYSILITSTEVFPFPSISTLTGTGNITISHSSFISNNQGILVAGNAYVSHSIIASNKGSGGLRVGRDLHMQNSKVLSNSFRVYGSHDNSAEWMLSNQGAGVYVGANAWITNSAISKNECFSEPVRPHSLGNCDRGGGIYVFNSLHLENSIIRENHLAGHFGAGVYAKTAYVTNSHIISNGVGGMVSGEGEINRLNWIGGGIYAGQLFMRDSVVKDNVALSGSGIVAEKVVISNTLITGNRTVSNPINGEPSGAGAGFWVATGKIYNSEVSNNHAGSGAGGYVQQEANPSQSLTIKNSIFANNSALVGGGIFIESSNIEFVDSQFVENKAGLSGGAIAIPSNRLKKSNSIIISNSIFHNNVLTKMHSMHSPTQGDDISLSQFHSAYSSIITQTNIGLSFNHVTFFSDQPTTTASVFISYPVNINVTNSAVVGYETGIENHGATITEAHNFFSNTTNLSGSVNSVGGSLFDLEPRFFNPAAGDFHLQPSSPLIDAAQISTSLSTDFEGNVRPFGDAPDIGAFEFNKPNLSTAFTVTVALTGAGSGFITGLPNIDSCDSICVVDVQAGTVLTLEAHLAPDSIFNGWSLPCDVSTVCEFIVKSDIEITAEFKRKESPQALTKVFYLPLIGLP